MISQVSGAPDVDGSTARRPASDAPRPGLAVLVAWATGSSGAALEGWTDSVANQRATLALLACTLVFTLAVAARTPRTAARAALGVASAGVAGAVAMPQLGRFPTALAFAGVVVALAAITGWRPSIRSPHRGSPVRLAVPPLVASPVASLWSHQPVVSVACLAAAGALVVAETVRPRPFAGPETRAEGVGRWLRSATGWADGSRWARRLPGQLIETLRGPRSRRDEAVIAAVVVGGVARLAWVTVMTNGYSHWYSAWNLRFADQIAAGRTPSIDGRPTAYWPPGYGMVLSPIDWLADQIGWLDVEHGASFLNVVAGVLTIVFAAALAREWVSPRASAPAAWLVALAPGQIYATSAAEAEVFVTLLWVAVAWAGTVIVRRRAGSARSGPLFALGLLVGAAALTKDISISLVLVPALALRGSTGSWRGGLRATVAVLLGAVVLLAPWAVRNAVQVGHLSPFATVGPEGLCATTFDMDARTYFADGGGALAMHRDELVECYQGSIFDDPTSEVGVPMPSWWEYGTPDEAAWARRNTSHFVGWAVRHPLHFVEVTPIRLYDVAGSDDTGGLEIATKHTERPIAGPLATDVMRNLANAWYYLVLGTSVLALATSRHHRRAIVLWAPMVLLTAQTIAAPWGQSRHAFSAHPFLAVLAAAVFGTVLASAAQERRTRAP